MSAEADLKSALFQGGDTACPDLFDECLRAVGKPADALGKADRLKLVALMEQKSLFLPQIRALRGQAPGGKPVYGI